jgi:hypothetical protein
VLVRVRAFDPATIALLTETGGGMFEVEETLLALAP